MPKIYEELGKNLRKYRKNKNLTTPELAQLLGVSTGLINNIENGKNDVFKLQLLFKIIEVLDISFGQLLDIESLDVRDLNIAEEINHIIKNNLTSSSNDKLNRLNQNINSIVKAYIAAITHCGYSIDAIDTISNHVLEELHFIRKIDSIKSKAPVA